MKVIKKAKPRTNVDNQQLIDNVSGMIRNVRQNGDKALLEYNARFDQNLHMVGKCTLSNAQILHQYAGATFAAPQSLQYL